MLFGIFIISGSKFSNLQEESVTEDFILTVDELMKTEGEYLGQISLDNGVLTPSYTLLGVNACRKIGQAIKSGVWNSCESKTIYFDQDDNYHGGFAKICKIHQR